MASTTTLRQNITRTAENWFESPGGGTRLLPMEGLRGMAVLLVFFVHAHALFGSYIATRPNLFSISQYLGGIGNVGVDLFFALSGFLIYGALVHKRIAYLSFLRRRAVRIYPAFLAVLSCYLVISIVVPSASKLPGSPTAAMRYILENLIFLPGLWPITPIVTVAWSLSFELAFYLFVPLAVLILPHDGRSRGRRIAVIGAIWVVFSLLEAFVLHGAHIRMLSFLSGMLLQEITGNGWTGSLASRTGQWASILALVLLAGYHFALRPKPLDTTSTGVLSVAMLSAAVFFFSFYALEYPGVLQKVCVWRPMRYWGNISYSYYLMHGLTLKGVALLLIHLRPTWHPVLTYCTALILGLAATLTSAIFLYALVERPFSLSPKKQQAKTENGEIVSISASMVKGALSPKFPCNG
jgi:peptidoglycan/LPS O-acetylase OafA/YrhL